MMQCSLKWMFGDLEKFRQGRIMSMVVTEILFFIVHSEWKPEEQCSTIARIKSSDAVWWENNTNIVINLGLVVIHIGNVEDL